MLFAAGAAFLGFAERKLDVQAAQLNAKMEMAKEAADMAQAVQADVCTPEGEGLGAVAPLGFIAIK